MIYCVCHLQDACFWMNQIFHDYILLNDLLKAVACLMLSVFNFDLWAVQAITLSWKNIHFCDFFMWIMLLLCINRIACSTYIPVHTNTWTTFYEGVFLVLLMEFVFVNWKTSRHRDQITFVTHSERHLLQNWGRMEIVVWDWKATAWEVVDSNSWK